MVDRYRCSDRQFFGCTRLHRSDGNNFTRTHFDCIWKAPNAIPASTTDDQRQCAYKPAMGLLDASFSKIST